MEQSKHLFVYQTTAEIQGIGLCSKMSTISESKVVAQSTAMEKFGGENLAKSTNPSYVYSYIELYIINSIYTTPFFFLFII